MISKWQEIATSLRCVARTACATAALPICATVRSTTLVNSSIATRSCCSASARAMVTRNCSPVDSTWNGRSQDGGLLNPTEDRSIVISTMDIPAGNASSTLLFSGQSNPETKDSPNSERAMVVFPVPLAPIIAPIAHGRSWRGSETSHRTTLSGAAARSNSPSTCWTRGVRFTGIRFTMAARSGPFRKSTPCTEAPRQSTVPASRADAPRLDR